MTLNKGKTFVQLSGILHIKFKDNSIHSFHLIQAFVATEKLIITLQYTI